MSTTPHAPSSLASPTASTPRPDLARQSLPPARPPARPATTIRRSQWSEVQNSAYDAAGGSSRDSVEAEWVYKDATGEEVFRLIGLESPGGRRRCRAAHVVPDGWEAGEGDGPLPLYRLDQLPAKGDKAVVFVLGGEVSADVAGVALDLPAVTSAFGAGFAHRTDWSPLAGRRVAILPDNDPRGRAYALEVAALLLALQPKPDLGELGRTVVKIVELPGLPPGGDISHFEEDRSLRFNKLPPEVGAEVRELANHAPLYRLPPAELGCGAEGAGTAVSVEAVLTRVSEVEAEEVQWLWPGRVALGKLTLLYGDPGLGKSLLTLDMAARVTTGAAWPDGRGSAPRGSAVLITAEDGQKDTVPARLARAGADATKIVTLDEVKETVPNPAGGAACGMELRRPFKLADWRVLDQTLEREGDVRLVVIDPLSAFLGDCGGTSNAATRALLAPIVKVAEKRRVAVVMVTHVTKGSGGKAMHRASGSLAFPAAARAVWLAAADPKDQKRTLLLPVKNNLAGDEGGLAYRTADGVVAWEAGPVKRRPDEALAGGGRRPRGRRPLQRRAAATWLLSRLANGPVPVGGKNPPPGTLRAEMRALRLSWGSVVRASDDLGVVKEHCPTLGQSVWRMPTDVDGKERVDE